MPATISLAIVGAAFLLSWAAETAQLDISAGLAIAEFASLVLQPGRLCSNGKPVPLNQPDFVKFAKENAYRPSVTKLIEIAE